MSLEARRIAAVARIAPCLFGLRIAAPTVYSRHEIETMAGFVFAGLGAFDIVR